MANVVKEYFLAPSWDYPPGGAIALGNLIISPARPVPPLVAAAKLEDDVLIASTKRGFEWTRGRTRAHKFGIWTKFIEFLGIDAGIDLSAKKEDTFRFEHMETQEFFPDASYVEAAVKSSPTAQRLLVKQHKPLFIIVGVKAVSGAAVKGVWHRTAGGTLGVSVDPALAGSPVPVSLGPSIEESIGDEQSISFRESDDFVFAFRVQRLRFSRKDGGGMRQEDYNKGAMLAYGDDSGTGDEAGLIQISGVDPEDLTMASFDEATVSDEDEDKDVRVFTKK